MRTALARIFLPYFDRPMTNPLLISTRMFGLLLLFVLADCSGCGADELASPTATRLRGLTTVYLDYAAAKGQGPPDERTLLGHVRNVPAFAAIVGVKDLGNLQTDFVSDRDKEPFVICYGVGLGTTPNADAPLIAFEGKGQDGTRWVAFANGKLDCVSDEAFVALRGSPGK
jgi:hypothetical protein